MLVQNESNGSPDFHVVVDVHADPPRVAVSGEVDLVTCAAFRDALSEAIEFADGVIEVDCQRLTFIGSIGIRELVRALQAVERIEIRSPAPIVRRALESAGLGRGLAIADR